MKRATIVLADTDQHYLVPLELKLIEELYDKIELEVITDKAYFEEYFAKSRDVEILVVSEDLYSQNMERQNIPNVFLLTEQYVKERTGDLNVNKIFKYTSVKEIYNEILFNTKSKMFDKRETIIAPKIVLVYSALGGSGKTTTAVAVSNCLAANHKRVLFISVEQLQSFQYYLQEKTAVSTELCSELYSGNKNIYEKVKWHIKKERFSYLPPFSVSLASLGIDTGVYHELLKEIKKSGDYDFIVVDTSNDYSKEKADLLGLADKTIILVEQDEYALIKTNALLANIDCSDEDRFIFVCNKYDNTKTNAIVSSAYGKNFHVSVYIDYADGMDSKSLDAISKLEGFQKLAYFLD